MLGQRTYKLALAEFEKALETNIKLDILCLITQHDDGVRLK